MELNIYRALTKGQASAECQNCFQTGHWTYQCRSEKVYLSRPSRTQTLKNPKLRPAFLEDENIPEIPLITDGDYARDPRLVEEMAAEVRLRARAAKSSSSSSSSSDSSSSDSSSSSSSSSSHSSSSSSSSSDSSSSSSSSDSSTDSSSSSDESSRGRSRRKRRRGVKRGRRREAEGGKGRGRCKREERVQLRRMKEEADGEAAGARQLKRSASLDRSYCKQEAHGSKQPQEPQQQYAIARTAEGRGHERDARGDGDRQRDWRREGTSSVRQRETQHQAAAAASVGSLKKERTEERHRDESDHWRQPGRGQYTAAGSSAEANEYESRKRRRQERRSREREHNSRRERQKEKQVEKYHEDRGGERDCRRGVQQQPSAKEHRDAMQSSKEKEGRELLDDDTGVTRRYPAGGSSACRDRERRHHAREEDSREDGRGIRRAEAEGIARRRHTPELDGDDLSSRRTQQCDYSERRNKERPSYYSREADARGEAGKGNFAELRGGMKRRHRDEGESETLHRIEERREDSPSEEYGSWERRHRRPEESREGRRAEERKKGPHERAWRELHAAQYEDRERRRERSADGRGDSTNLNHGEEEKEGERRNRSGQKRRDEAAGRDKHPQAREREGKDAAFGGDQKKRVTEERHQESRGEKTATHSSLDGVSTAEGRGGGSARRERRDRDDRANGQDEAREAEDYRRRDDADRKRRKRDGRGVEFTGGREVEKKVAGHGARTNKQRRDGRGEEKETREVNGEDRTRTYRRGREKSNEDAHT